MAPQWKTYRDSLRIRDLGQVFATAKPVIGMVHCWPLPGAPKYRDVGHVVLHGVERVVPPV
jgi:hypothetical protein